MGTRICTGIREGAHGSVLTYLQSPEERLLVSSRGVLNLRNHTDDIHPLVVSQVTQNHSTNREGLIA